MFPKTKRRKSKGDAQRTPDGWGKERERKRSREELKSRLGRNIAPMPDVADPARKEYCRTRLRRFMETYLAGVFYRTWSKSHKRAIKKIARAIIKGAKFALAMPRGEGKTAIIIAAAMWALLYGYRHYVMVIGASEPKSRRIMESIRTQLSMNPTLAADFPEVCHPIRSLEGIVNRCSGQHLNGVPTGMKWKSDVLVLPTIPGSIASGAIVQVSGADGAFRGANYTRINRDGHPEIIRPDLAVVDDIQKRKTAGSPNEVAKLKELINADVLGLAAAGDTIAAFFLCTVIQENDLADQMLDRNQNPEWQGERTKRLISEPSNAAMWEAYHRLRQDELRDGGDGSEANKFYLLHRTEMDAGAEVSWPELFKEREISAIQSAMNEKLARPEAFASEMQNEPLSKNATETELLTAVQITAKINRIQRGIVAAEASKLTGFIDVQQDALFWVVCGFGSNFTGAAVDYNVYPEQPTSRFRLDNLKVKLQDFRKAGSFEEALYGGLEYLLLQLIDRDWPKQDGTTARMNRLLIDCNWKDSQTIVRKLCNDPRFKSVAMPSRGTAVKAGGGRFNDRQPKPNERRGLNWRVEVTKDFPIQHMLTFEANLYKTFVCQRLKVGLGGAGCLSLFGDDPHQHELLADHMLAEMPRTFTDESSGARMTFWSLPPSRPDNHWLDGIVGCHVAASEQGISLDELRTASSSTPRVRMKMSDVLKQRDLERTRRGK